MCIISINETRDLTKKEFDNCWEVNSHGAGFAWGNKFHKGFMTKEEAYKFYRENVIGNYPHVVHFRIQTSGGTRPELTHPFIIAPLSPAKLKGTTGTKGVLFHNGIISGWNKLLLNYAIAEGDYPVGHLSDTRVLAMCVSRGSQYIISCLDGNDRFVLFKNGAYTKWGTWETENGVLFSNSGYKDNYYKPYKYNGTYNNTKSFWDDDWRSTYLECNVTNCSEYLKTKIRGCRVNFTEKDVKACEIYKAYNEADKGKKQNGFTGCTLSSCDFYDLKSLDKCSSPYVCIDGDLYQQTRSSKKKNKDCEYPSCSHYDVTISGNCELFIDHTECKKYEVAG